MADVKVEEIAPTSIPIPTETSNGNPAPTAEPSPNDFVTPEILEAVMKSLNRPELELLDFEAKAATAAGDNFMALLYEVKLRLKNTKTGEIETRPVMLKVMPRNEFRQEMIRDGNIFVKEVAMYQDVLPALEKFQRELGLPESEIFAPWPHCYASKSDGTNDFIAMEDLKTVGFKMANRQEGLDIEHTKLVLKTLAKFHAVSFAMFQGDFEKIMEKYPLLEDTMFNELKMPETFKQFTQNTFAQQAAMIRDAGEEKGASLVEKIYSDQYFHDMYQLVGTKVRWAVIGHGDSWTNNFLFRYDEETNKPVEVKLLDFQLGRACSRAIDVHYFLHSSPKPEIFNEKEVELENFYFDEFNKHAAKLGVDIQGHELTKENFEKEISKFRYYGAVTGMFLAMVTSADSSDVPEMEKVTKEQFEGGDGAATFFGSMMGKAVEKARNISVRHLPRCEQMQKYL